MLFWEVKYKKQNHSVRFKSHLWEVTIFILRWKPAYNVLLKWNQMEDNWASIRNQLWYNTLINTRGGISRSTTNWQCSLAMKWKTRQRSVVTENTGPLFILWLLLRSCLIVIPPLPFPITKAHVETKVTLIRLYSEVFFWMLLHFAFQVDDCNCFEMFILYLILTSKYTCIRLSLSSLCIIEYKKFPCSIVFLQLVFIFTKGKTENLILL